jgi:hypothetical protein
MWTVECIQMSRQPTLNAIWRGTGTIFNSICSAKWLHPTRSTATQGPVGSRIKTVRMRGFHCSWASSDSSSIGDIFPFRLWQYWYSVRTIEYRRAWSDANDTYKIPSHPILGIIDAPDVFVLRFWFPVTSKMDTENFASDVDEDA